MAEVRHFASIRDCLPPDQIEDLQKFRESLPEFHRSRIIRGLTPGQRKNWIETAGNHSPSPYTIAVVREMYWLSETMKEGAEKEACRKAIELWLQTYMKV